MDFFGFFKEIIEFRNSDNSLFAKNRNFRSKYQIKIFQGVKIAGKLIFLDLFVKIDHFKS